MGGGVRVLLVLAQPLFIVPRLRGFLDRMERLIALIPREERGHEQQQHDDDGPFEAAVADQARSEEHTSELQSLMRNSYAVFCLTKKQTKDRNNIRRYSSAS